MEETEGRETNRLVLLLSIILSHCLLGYIAEKQATGNQRGAKDVEELDQVAGNAEDEIGERIAGVRESELLYGPQSLLALYGPMIVHICGSPHKFKVFPSLTRTLLKNGFSFPESNSTCGCHSVIQQVPLRQFAVLRPTPSIIV